MARCRDRLRGTVLSACAAAALALSASCVLAVAPATAAIGSYTTKGAWSFVSAPNLHPPKMLTDAPTNTRSLTRGDFLLDNFPDVLASGPMTGEGGPLILNSKLQPVWSYPVGTNVASTDLQQETYAGKPVLVWWEGVVGATGAATQGQVFVVNQHYRQIAKLKAQGPSGCSGTSCWIISVHDAQISGDDIWVTVYRTVADQNLAPYGGSASGSVYDAGVQEYDLATGKLLYTWDALNPGGTANVPLSESQQPASVPTGPDGSWDAYHINSIQPLPDNQLLVSLRNTWAVYLINTTTGQPAWTLGGNASNFSFGPGASFRWQHDVEMQPDGDLTVFDDNCCAILPGGKFGPSGGVSAGLVLSLNTSAHTASLAGSYGASQKRTTAFLGSMQVLPGGNALVGYGSLPYFSEYSKSGKLLLDARWPGKDLSYRALFSSNWVGTPSSPPRGAARVSRGHATIYASWDGATQVSRWRVLAGSSTSHLSSVASASWNGLETAIRLSHTYSVYKVVALDARGHTLGTSAAFRAPSTSSKKGKGTAPGSSGGLPQSY
jgi:Arylsulfotransferase (ASST)